MALRFGLKCVVAAATVATAAALTIIDVSTDPRQDVDITGTAYPTGLRVLGLGAKNVTLREVTVGCPGLHVSGGQDAAGHLALVNVTATCNDVPANNAVIFMNGGHLRGSVVFDSCTVTAPNATQSGSHVLQIRKAAGRLAIRGGRYALNSSRPTHRCIDFRNVRDTAAITVENVDASIAVSGYTRFFFGMVSVALRVDRMLAGGSVAITNSRFVTDIPEEWSGYGIEVESAAVGSTVTLRNVSSDVNGRGSMRALGVLSSSCALTVDGSRFVANAVFSFVDAVRFEDFSGAATFTSTSISATAARSDNAVALALATVNGQVTVIDSTLTATAANQNAQALSSTGLSGAMAALIIRGCTFTASSKNFLQAVILESHGGGSSVAISNSTLLAHPDPAKFTGSATALMVSRVESATVDVFDCRLVARGSWNIAASSFRLGVGAAFSVTRSTLEATAGGDGAAGVVFGYSRNTLTVTDCTVTARAGDEEALGVELSTRLGGALTILRSAFVVSAASDRSATSGGLISEAREFTEMNGLRLTIADSTFDGSSSASPLLFVRFPRRWEGQSSVAITNVTMTEQFNSTTHGLVSTDGSNGAYFVEGANATRCLTGLVLGGVAVADNFALPGVPSTVDCATPSPTAAPTPIPDTPAPVSAASSSSSVTASSAADASAASSSSDTAPDAVVTINATALAGDNIQITGTAYPAGLRVLGLGAKNVTLRDVTVGCPGLHVSGGQDAAGHLALVNVTATCNDVPANNAVIFMNGGHLRGSVVFDSCTVTAPNATQSGSHVLQIRKAAGRLAIRGGRYALNSSRPTHRCIDFRNVRDTAAITVENVDASIAVSGYTRFFFGMVSVALRVDRMLAGGSVAITNSRFVTDIPEEWSGYGIEVESAAVGSAVTLRNVSSDVNGRGSMRALGVLSSSCALTVDGSRFVANAVFSFVDAIRFEDFSGAAVFTSTSISATAARSDNAVALALATVNGQVTVIDSTLTATAANQNAQALSSTGLSGAMAALIVRGCTFTASSKNFQQALSLESHSGGSSVAISNSTLLAHPDPAKFTGSATALQVSRVESSTVDVSDCRLVARGSWNIAAASFRLGVDAAFSVTRSTLEATAGGDGAAGVVFGYSRNALTVADCTVTARAGDEEALGVELSTRLGGALTILHTAFAVSAASDRSATSGGLISEAREFTEMNGLRLTIADSTFDGSGSASPLLFVRFPRRWEGQSSVAITNVTMTEQFNSTTHGLVSTDGSNGAYFVAGANATRCLTGLVLGGVAVADNFALPGVPSTVDCATPAPTAAPTPVPETPASVSAASNSSSVTASFAADASAASSSSDTTPDAVATINATALVGDNIQITGTAYATGLRLLGLGAKNVTLRDVTVRCPGLHVSGGQDAAGHLALINVTASCNDVPTNNAVIFMNGGHLRGTVLLDSCTVTAPNATQQGSDLLQIRKAAGRFAIRGGRYVLSSSQPTHRCIDLRNVQGTAVVTVENVDASVTVLGQTRFFFGLVASALRVDRMLTGGSVAISNGRFVTVIPQEFSGIGVEIQSAVLGSSVSLRGMSVEVHGLAYLHALDVLASSCTVTVDGGRLFANASFSTANAARFGNYGGAATFTSTSMAAVVARSDNAAALSMSTVGGQVTVVDSTLSAKAKNSNAQTVSSSRLSGAGAMLAIRGCTITASSRYNAQAVSLQSHSDKSAVTISNSTLQVGPDATVSVDWMSAPDALLVKRVSGSATVDVSDSRLIARGASSVSAASFTLGSTGAAFSVTRSTLEATAGSDRAFGVVFGYTSSALTLADCTVTARATDEEALGVRLYEGLSGSLTVLRSAFAVSAARDRSATSGGLISEGSVFTEMDGFNLTVADSTFDGSSSATPMLFVRLPRRWEGENRVAITNVTMTEQFNSTERGLVSMATDGNHGVYVKPGSSATRCLTGLVLGGVAVADNFALPGVPSTVDCATLAPTPASSSSSAEAASSASPGASSSAGVTPAPAVVPAPSASSHESSASVPATPQPTAAPGPSPSPTAAPTATPAPTPAPASSPAPTTSPATPVPPTRPVTTPAPTPSPQTPSPANGQRGGGGHAAAGTPDSTPALSTAATVSIAVVAGVAVIVAVIAVAAFLVVRRAASRVSPVTTAPDDQTNTHGTTNSAATTEREMYRVDVFPAPGAVLDHNDPFGKLQHQEATEENVVLGQVAQP